jgi:hypothetical protein
MLGLDLFPISRSFLETKLPPSKEAESRGSGPRQTILSPTQFPPFPYQGQADKPPPQVARPQKPQSTLITLISLSPFNSLVGKGDFSFIHPTSDINSGKRMMGY